MRFLDISRIISRSIKFETKLHNAQKLCGFAWRCVVAPGTVARRAEGEVAPVTAGRAEDVHSSSRNTSDPQRSEKSQPASNCSGLFRWKPALLPTSPHFHGPLCLTGDVGAAAVAAAGALLLGLVAGSAVSGFVDVQLPQRPWPRPPAVTGDQWGKSQESCETGN